MKTTVYFKQFLPALATLVTVGFASSCQDQNFDWDDAHAKTAQEKFTNTFIKEFGKPAEGHQWGFDMLWNKQSTRAIITGANVIKPDMGGQDNCDTRDFYGVATNITQKEHEEVYEWFSTHQVTWTNTTRVVGKTKDGAKLYDSSNNEVTTKGQIVENGKVVLANGKDIEGTFCIIANGNDDGEIVKYVYGTGTRNEGTTTLAKKTADLSAGNTLRTYSPECVDDVYVGLKISFTHAWIQHVAYDKDSNVPDRTKEKDLKGNTVFQYNSNGQQTASKMDYLQFYLEGNATAHTNDFNGNGGNQSNWGWGNQNTSFTEGSRTYPKNGILMLNANFDNTSYSASLGSLNNIANDKIHDKWILVYLAGEDYAGWYLGFDFESSGADWNANVGANGYCNNWIVKLSNLNPYKNTACRIMCEDLGGENNSVTIGTTTHVSDIDYNDIVLDVIPQTWNSASSAWVDDNNSANITLRLQAAGGTLPLTVWYDEACLFETHELLQQDLHYSDSNNSHNATYSTMYNTAAENGESVQSKDVHLIFGQASNNKDSYKNYNRKGNFDLERLHIKVWRHSVEDYKLSNGSYSDADWLTLKNYEGSAPLKICLPIEVKWLKERKAVTTGYPHFKEWVGEPTSKFWVTDGYNSDNLYK